MDGRPAMDGGMEPLNQRLGNSGEIALETVIYEHFKGFDELFDTVWDGCKNSRRSRLSAAIASQETRA